VLRQQFGAQIRGELEQRLAQAIPGGADAQSGAQMDGKDQVLNEEGLPFVDPLETLPDSPPATPRLDSVQPRGAAPNVLGRTPGRIVPFERDSGALPEGQNRQQWVASVLDALEAEEEHEEPMPQEPASAPPAAAPRAGAAQPPSGSESRFSAFKRGFLNQRREEAADQAPEPEKAPALADKPPAPKKQVRIQAPPDHDDEEEEIEELIQTAKRNAVASRTGRDVEDIGVEEEAARIVELLGPEVIRGHPNADRILGEIAAAQPAPPPPASASPAKRPARPPKNPVGAAVIEREPSASETPRNARAAAPGKKMSAFKRHKLGASAEAPSEPQEPAASSSQAAAPPTPQAAAAASFAQEPQGMEKAAHVDEQLSKDRIEHGLPPAVPHARPSKAYAEKLARRQRGETERASPMVDEGDVSAQRRRGVRFGGETVIGEEEDEAADEAPMDQDEEGVQDAEEGSDDQSTDYDSLWDSEDEYDPEDLEALRPSMEGHEGDAYWDEELAREYAEAKARLALRPPPAPATEEDMRDVEEEYGVAPMSASVADRADLGNTARGRERPKVSRFRAARAQRAADAQEQDYAGHALAHQLHETTLDDDGHAQDAEKGPMMVLPSLAPVRYPRPHPEGAEDRGIDLEGESDSDDERLQAAMRARLDAEAAGTTRESAAQPSAPPQVGPRRM